MKKNIVIILSLLLVVSCATRITPAPIVNVTKVPTYLDSKPAIPTFSKNNETSNNNGSDTTLGSIDDGITQPVPQTNSKVTRANTDVAPVTVTSNKNQTWILPTDGVIIRKFTPANKGIDYTGKFGQKIVAINDGKVVYSGNGLKGYGNLIIIKHDKIYLSAYANNHVNLVKEGEMVKRGQEIATMGKLADGKPNMHFEIRQNGRPVEPSILLK